MMRFTQLALVVGLVGVATAQDLITIRTGRSNPARRVSALVTELRKTEHLAISYEDPRYVRTQDMGGPDLSFEYNVRELNGPDGAELVVGRMLREYAESGGLSFEVQKQATRLYVVPEEVKNAKEERVRQESILDTVIDVPAGRRDGGQLLEAICEAVKQQAGYKIDIGQIPSNNFQRYSVQDGIHGQTARAALSQLLDRATPAGTFVWDLYYDPDDESYGLTISYIGRAGPIQK